MIGSGIASMFNNLMGVRANAIGVGGLPGILAINATEGGGLLAFGMAMLIAIVVPFILTIVFRRQGIFNKIDSVNSVEDNAYTEGLATAGASAGVANTPSQTISKETTVTEEMLYAPADGQIIAIGEVEDPVFSQKMMGDGYAVRPSNGKIYAPVAGTVSSIFETKHAIGILTPGGAEVLVHMGLDTVELKGAPFTVKVSEGDAVTVDTLIAEMDLEAVTKAGKKTDVVTVLTNAEKINQLTINKTGSVHAHDRVGAADVR